MERLILSGIMFGTEGIRRTYSRSLQSLLDDWAKICGFSQVNEAAQCSVGISRCRVDQEAGLIAPNRAAALAEWRQLGVA